MPENEKMSRSTDGSRDPNGANAAMFLMPDPLRFFTENQIAHGKETLESLTTAVQGACATNIEAFNTYGEKLREAGQQDMDETLDCWRAMLAAKSPSEAIEIWATRAPRRLETLTNRAGEFWMLFSKLAAEQTKPMIKGAIPGRMSQE
ncbi:phasin family protein [Microbacteriaceae bacterium K1510]|nr:phasin family protein [Microbacteriaceae bacterium K1510]